MEAQHNYHSELQKKTEEIELLRAEVRKLKATQFQQVSNTSEDLARSLERAELSALHSVNPEPIVTLSSLQRKASESVNEAISSGGTEYEPMSRLLKNVLRDLIAQGDNSVKTLVEDLAANRAGAAQKLLRYLAEASPESMKDVMRARDMTKIGSQFNAQAGFPDTYSPDVAENKTSEEAAERFANKRDRPGSNNLLHSFPDQNKIKTEHKITAPVLSNIESRKGILDLNALNNGGIGSNIPNGLPNDGDFVPSSQRFAQNLQNFVSSSPISYPSKATMTENNLNYSFSMNSFPTSNPHIGMNHLSPTSTPMNFLQTANNFSSAPLSPIGVNMGSMLGNQDVNMAGQMNSFNLMRNDLMQNMQNSSFNALNLDHAWKNPTPSARKPQDVNSLFLERFRSNQIKAEMQRRRSQSQAPMLSVSAMETNSNKEDDGEKKPRRWTDEEDLLLKRAVITNGGKNWRRISMDVPNRNHVQCLQRWKKALDPSVVKGHWGSEEDEQLLALVQANPKNWGYVAKGIKGRTAKQCRERYHNHLNPNIKKGDWALEEDVAILRKQRAIGNKWADIAKLLDGRTENSVKIRWKSIKRQVQALYLERKSGTLDGQRRKNKRSTMDQDRLEQLIRVWTQLEESAPSEGGEVNSNSESDE